MKETARQLYKMFIKGPGRHVPCPRVQTNKQTGWGTGSRDRTPSDMTFLMGERDRERLRSGIVHCGEQTFLNPTLKITINRNVVLTN